MLNLGLTTAEWEDIEYEYKTSSTNIKKFMALRKWWSKEDASMLTASLEKLALALQQIEDNRHHLCFVCFYVRNNA